MRGPLVEVGPRPGLVALVKKRGEHRHVVHARNLAATLVRAAELADGGYQYRVLSAHTHPGEWAVLVGGGCRELVPVVCVWSKHGSWELTPGEAHLLAGTVTRMAGVDSPYSFTTLGA